MAVKSFRRGDGILNLLTKGDDSIQARQKIHSPDCGQKISNM